MVVSHPEPESMRRDKYHHYNQLMANGSGEYGPRLWINCNDIKIDGKSNSRPKMMKWVSPRRLQSKTERGTFDFHGGRPALWKQSTNLGNQYERVYSKDYHSSDGWISNFHVFFHVCCTCSGQWECKEGGTEVTFAEMPWEDGQPNNFGGPQNCAALNVLAVPSGGWGDVACDVQYYTVCKRM